MMDNTERKFHWCLEKGKTGGRKHHGLRKIKPDPQEAENHIQKALHNLDAAGYNIKGGFGDWAVSAAFYAMYRSLLAILFKLGYDSRNQECTINAVDHFIKTGRIKLDSKYIAMIRRTDEMMGSDAKALREEFQCYNVPGEKLSEELLSDRKKDKVTKHNKIFVSQTHGMDTAALSPPDKAPRPPRNHDGRGGHYSSLGNPASIKK